MKYFFNSFFFMPPIWYVLFVTRFFFIIFTGFFPSFIKELLLCCIAFLFSYVLSVFLSVYVLNCLCDFRDFCFFVLCLFFCLALSFFVNILANFCTVFPFLFPFVYLLPSSFLFANNAVYLLCFLHFIKCPTRKELLPQID